MGEYVTSLIGFGAEAQLNRIAVSLGAAVGDYLGASANRMDFLLLPGPATTLRVEGLDANATYYLYFEDHAQSHDLQTDGAGSLLWNIPARSKDKTHLWIDTQPGTIDIRAPEDCQAQLGGVLEGNICRLNSDITDSLNISVNDFVLDCQGHTLWAESSAGAMLGNASKMGLSNCTISSPPPHTAAVGVEISQTTNAVLYNIKFVGEMETGLRVLDSAAPVLTKIRIVDQVVGDVPVAKLVGIELAHTIDAQVEEIEIQDATRGVEWLDNKKGSLHDVTLTGWQGSLLRIGLRADAEQDDEALPLVWHNNFIPTAREGFESVQVAVGGFFDYQGFFDASQPKPMKLQNGNAGNFWGRTQHPLYVAGPDRDGVQVDTNAADVVDLYPYCEQDGWDHGAVPNQCTGQQGLPPTLQFQASALAVFHHQPIEFGFNAQDSDGEIVGFELDLGCDGVVEESHAPTPASQVSWNVSRSFDTATDNLRVCGRTIDDQGNPTQQELFVRIAPIEPVLQSLSPSLRNYDQPINLLLLGSGFMQGSEGPAQVCFDTGSPARCFAATTLDDGQLKLELPAWSLPPGIYEVRVETALPNGGFSNKLTFTVQFGPPVLTAVNPISFVKGCESSSAAPYCTGLIRLEGESFSPDMTLKIYNNYLGQADELVQVKPASLVAENLANAQIDLIDLDIGYHFVSLCHPAGLCSETLRIRIFSQDSQTLREVSVERSTLFYGDSEQVIAGRSWGVFPGAELSLINKNQQLVGVWPIDTQEDGAFSVTLVPHDIQGEALPEGSYLAQIANPGSSVAPQAFDIFVGKTGEHEQIVRNPDWRGPVLVHEKGSDSDNWGRIVVYTKENTSCFGVVSPIEQELPQVEDAGDRISAVTSTVFSGGFDQGDAEWFYRKTRHDIILPNLQYDMFYHYRVKCWTGSFWGTESYEVAKDVWFRTPPERGAGFRYAVMGDLFQCGNECAFLQIGPPTDGRILVGTTAAQKATAKKQFELQQRGFLDFILAAGDISNDLGWYSDYWDHYLLHWQKLMAGMPFFPVLGNHDLKSERQARLREDTDAQLEDPDGRDGSSGLFSFPEAGLPYFMLVPSPQHALRYNQESPDSFDRRPFLAAPDKLHYKAGEFYRVKWGDLLLISIGIADAANDTPEIELPLHLMWGYNAYKRPGLRGEGNALGQWLDDTLQTHADAPWKIVLSHAQIQKQSTYHWQCSESLGARYGEDEIFTQHSELVDRLYEAGVAVQHVGHAGYGLFGKWGDDFSGCAEEGAEGYVGNASDYLTMTDVFQQPVPGAMFKMVGATALNNYFGFLHAKMSSNNSSFVGYVSSVKEKCFNSYGEYQVDIEDEDCDAYRKPFRIEECGGISPPNFEECPAVEGLLSCIDMRQDDLVGGVFSENPDCGDECNYLSSSLTLNPNSRCRGYYACSSSENYLYSINPFSSGRRDNICAEIR